MGSQPVASWRRRGIAPQDRRVHRAEQVGIRDQGHRAVGQGDEAVGDLLDGDVATGAHVVGLAGLASLSQEPVGPDHVPHVGEVPAGAQVADRDLVAAADLVAGDAGGHRGRHEAVALPGPEVVEGPGPEHGQAVAEVRLQGDHIGGRLAGAVGTDGAKGPILTDRQVGLGHLAVHIGAGHGHDPLHAGLHGGVEHVQGALGVDAEGLDRAGPRPSHIGLPGEVVHDLRADRREQVGQPRRVEDVEAEMTVGLVDVVAGLLQPGDEVAPDEAGCAGDQGSHRPESTERRPGHSPPLGGTGPRGRRHGPPTSSDPLDGGLGPPWRPGAPRR